MPRGCSLSLSPYDQAMSNVLGGSDFTRGAGKEDDVVDMDDAIDKK